MYLMAQPDVVSSLAPSLGRRVLVVEDDLDLAQVVEEILTMVLGMQVVHAESADRAMQVLEEEAELGSSFDLVFTDIMMPGSMNGVQLAQLLLRIHPTLPVVLSTGNAPAASLRAVEDFPLIRKPYRVLELRQCFAATLNISPSDLTGFG